MLLSVFSLNSLNSRLSTEIPSFRTLRLLESFGDAEYGVGGGLLEMGDLVWSSCGGRGGDTFDAAKVFSVYQSYPDCSQIPGS